MATSRLSSILDHGKPKKIGKAYRFLTEVVLTHDGHECLLWPFSTTDGYGHMRWGGRDYLVHRLACESLNGEPPTRGHEAAHSCGNGHLGCVNRMHLSWKTRAENFADKIRHGTHSRGARQWNTKLTEDDVRQIRTLIPSFTRKEIADQFGVKPTTISAIFRGDSWAWLS